MSEDQLAVERLLATVFFWNALWLDYHQPRQGEPAEKS